MPDQETSAQISSEDAILSLLSEFFPITRSSILIGRGDDCAMFHVEQPLVVSSDLFLENIHFKTSYFTPEDIGYKALSVNLSDISACGASPYAFTLCLGLPETVDMNWLTRFFTGMQELTQKFNVNLIGGDLSRSETIHISITVFGKKTPTSCFLTRGGSMPGDILFVVGQIGLAHVGLDVLEEHGREACVKWPLACQAHLRPYPHCEAGLVLARAAMNARPVAIMDLSDGLLQDLPRLLGMNGELGGIHYNGTPLGAALSLQTEVIHPEVVKWANEKHKDPIQTVLKGGEDYALLGSCAPDLIPTFEAAIPEFQIIGMITTDSKISCNGHEVDTSFGFDHFRTNHRSA